MNARIFEGRFDVRLNKETGVISLAKGAGGGVKITINLGGQDLAATVVDHEPIDEVYREGQGSEDGHLLDAG